MNEVEKEKIYQMSEKKRKEPPTRQRFTEEVQENENISEADSTGLTVELQNELDRLRALPTVSGRTTIGMMEQYRNFPWTQDSMLLIGSSDEILKAFLEEYVKIECRTLEE